MNRQTFSGRANPDFSSERKPRLLLVDENPQDLSDYTAMLRYLGYEVRPSGSYVAAAGLLGKESFDLVMVDQGSTDFEGRSVLRQAVETDHRTPVLVLTGKVDAKCCVSALDMGATEYVQKPLAGSELRALVDDYLNPSSRLAAEGECMLMHTLSASGEPWRKAS